MVSSKRVVVKTSPPPRPVLPGRRMKKEHLNLPGAAGEHPVMVVPVEGVGFGQRGPDAAAELERYGDERRIVPAGEPDRQRQVDIGTVEFADREFHVDAGDGPVADSDGLLFALLDQPPFRKIPVEVADLVFDVRIAERNSV